MRAISLIAVAVAVTATIAVVRSRIEGNTTDDAAQAQVATHQLEVVTLNVPDMFCAGCEVGVKIAANKIEGVKEVKTDSDKRTADVTFDPLKTTAQAIATAITKGTGFKAEVTNNTKNRT